MSDRPFRPARSLPRKPLAAALAAALVVCAVGAVVLKVREPDRRPASRVAQPLPGQKPGPAVPPEAGPAPGASDGPEGAPVTAQLKELREQVAAKCPPGTDPAVIDRATARFGKRALAAAECAGAPGLTVLTAFGADAEELLLSDRDAFVRLARYGTLSDKRLQLAAGPWATYAVRWARDANHDRARQFAERLDKLTDAQLATAEQHPAALPLLFADAPNAHKALAEYGDTALRVLCAVDAAGRPEALDFVGQRILELRERLDHVATKFGPAAAFLLIGPPGATDKARALPEIVRFALEHPSHLPAEEVLALFLNALPKVLEDLRAGVPPETIKEAFTRYAALDDVVRLLAADHPDSLRLLAEEVDGAPVGVRVMERCGPEAADVVYAHYADPALRPGVLVTLATVGWGGKGEPVRTLLESGKDGELLAFLTRATGLKLHEGNSPLLPRGVLLVATGDRADVLKQFRGADNLQGQLQRLLEPRDDGIFEWIPGYTVVTTVQDYNRGLHVSRRDALMAVLDAADVAVTVYTLGGSSAATAGTKTGGTVVKGVTKQVSKEAAETTFKRIAQQGGKAVASQSDDAVRRVMTKAPHLQKLGAEGTKAAGTRVAAQGRGVAAQSLWDRASLDALGDRVKKEAREWATDVPSRSLDAAQLGVRKYPAAVKWFEGLAAEGASKYARSAGYVPVRVEAGRADHGLGLVFRDGDRLVVLEAIAAGLGRRTIGAFEQGTVEYTKAAAERVLNGDYPEDLKAVAREVLKAGEDRRLHVETVATFHADGLPTLVRVIRAVGPDGEIRPELPGHLNMVAGWATALLAEFQMHSAHWSVRSWLRYQSGPAARLGLPVWPDTGAQTPAAHPTGTGAVGDLPAALQIGTVDEFAAALAELLM